VRSISLSHKGVILVKFSSRVLVTAIFTVAVFTLSGCTTDGGSPKAQSATSKENPVMTASATPSQSSVAANPTNLPAVTGEKGKAPVIAAPKGSAPTTLVTKDIFVGSGATAIATSTLTVQYTLMAWSTGKAIESSWTGGQPATFPLSGVIAGWQKGIPGMKIGGRRLLVIPPALGYGATGSGPVGPNETLVFVVDVLGIK
jgi:peptidylprolyl isomerase